MVLGGQTTGDSARRDRARVPLPDAGAAKHRDDERGWRQADRGHLRALLQRAGERVPAGRRPLRGGPPHHPVGPAAGADKRLHPGQPGRRQCHLPRPVLPRSAQPDLRPATRSHPVRARGAVGRLCRGRRNAPSAAAPVGPGCGWTGLPRHRISLNRADEALSLKPDMVTAGCPFCITMLSDGVSQRTLGRRNGKASRSPTWPRCSCARCGPTWWTPFRRADRAERIDRRPRRHQRRWRPQPDDRDAWPGSAPTWPSPTTPCRPTSP